MNRLKWEILPSAPAKYLTRYPDIPPLLAQLLYNRGIKSLSEAELFLLADKRLENDSALLPDIDKAAARILRALLDGETIAVYGDFDADGVTGTTLLVQGLSNLGGRVIPYIPHRVEEGHGLNLPALKGLRQQGVTLIVTVDCGVTAYAEVDEAKKVGLDLLITDHHLITTPIPPALAVVNPKRNDSAYPFRELAGVGVAFKLLQHLFRATGRDENADQFLDLVALGTVADLVPLLGENRYLVKRGLEILNTTDRLGVKELINCAGLQMGQLDTESISYMLAPRLNAAGRLDHALISYDLLTTDSLDEAQQLAAHLELRNAERQRLTNQLLAQAERKLLTLSPDIPLLMIWSEDFHAGVNGLVAKKLTDKYHRPAVVLEVGTKESRGSARSIPEFDLVAALSECQELLSQFGGHARAAGFTLPTENVERLHHQLLKIARRNLASVELQPTITIDAEVSLAALGGETFKLVKMLEPFGQANPPPVFITRDVEVVNCHKVGSDGEHLKLKLRDEGIIWDAVGFSLGHLNDCITSNLNIVYNLRVEDWGGKESLQLEILDLASSA